MSSKKMKVRTSISSAKEHKAALFLVAFVGVIGSVYVLSTINTSRSKTVQNIQVPRDTNQKHNAKILDFAPQTSIAEEVEFSISNFNPELSYFFKVGSETKSVKRARFSYAFTKAGIYELVLEVHHQEAVYVLDRGEIEVEDSFAILEP